MDCQSDPRLSTDLVGVDCTNIPDACQPCYDFASCPEAALNGRDCDDVPPQCAECAPYAVCLSDLAAIYTMCGSDDPCAAVTVR
jgi:hypothetical protein